jgi:hypothetical protein
MAVSLFHTEIGNTVLRRGIVCFLATIILNREQEQHKTNVHTKEIRSTFETENISITTLHKEIKIETYIYDGSNSNNMVREHHPITYVKRHNEPWKVASPTTLDK